MNIFGRNDSLKNMSSHQGFKDRVDIRSRRGGSHSLKPSLIVESVNPICNSGQRRDAFLANQFAIKKFFGIPDSCHTLSSSRAAQPLWKDRIVSLAERGKKLLMSDGNA